MGFDLYTARRDDLIPQVNDIARSYFSLDTATPQTAGTWYQKNPSCLIIAVNNGNVYGYADFLPLTADAQRLIEERRLKEEDIGPDHILSFDQLSECRAVYFAGIAVRNRKTLLAARCTAALVAGCVHMLGAIYNKEKLDVFYTNPTTFSGNRLTRRMGLSPVSFATKNLAGMDLYMMPLQQGQQDKMRDLYNLYKPYITSMEWDSKSA
jgi:hypothetical protein